MRGIMLLIALLLEAAAAIIIGLTTNPDVNTALALAFAGLAVWFTAELLEGRYP